MIEDHIKRVQDNMAGACIRAGRNLSEVTLLAVTKFVPVERIAPAISLGLIHVGENRVQELVQKLGFFEKNRCIVHCIGQLQTNKVKYILGKVHLIQSVDRMQLAKEISRIAEKNTLTQNILVQVNIGDEAQKGGVDASGLFDFLDELKALPGLCTKGLMCIPPAVEAEEARPYFKKMRQLFEKARAVYPEMEQLSMGMSGDYEVAIEEGATIIRVGSALFGTRTYH